MSTSDNGGWRRWLMGGGSLLAGTAAIMLLRLGTWEALAIVLGFGSALGLLGAVGPENIKSLAVKFKDWTFELKSRDPADKQPQTQLPEQDPPLELPARTVEEVSEDIRVSLARLPTTSATFEGRDEELARLDAAWAADHIHILSIVAPGGVGKTALVNTWLGRMAKKDYRSARRVYGWSFYSQGAGESKAASGDVFLAEALAFFGDEDPEAGSPWQRGERLAGLVQQERTLLVLDGLEPLQEPPRTGLPAGRLKDPGLQALLRNLAASNNGLCLITTREKVVDLDSRVGSTVERLDLNELPPEAGAAVLRAYGLEAPEKEFREISQAFAGHALALTLLATYLRDAQEGEVRAWREVPILEEAAEQGGHAIRVMKSYEEWLGKGAELSVLYLLGLFDRPVSKEEIEALLEEPEIPGLTEDLVQGSSRRSSKAGPRPTMNRRAK